jgi:hypothetical protein
MPTSADALQILIFVLPGLLSAKLRDALSAGRDRTIAELFFDGLLFTLFNWSIAQIVFAAFPALLAATTMPIEDQGLISTAINQLQVQGGVTVLLIAIVTGILSGVGSNNDWFYRALRTLRLTTRASSQDVWTQAFDTFRGKWLIVTLEDKTRYRGWARYYSVSEGKPELFLSDAARVNDDGSLTEIKGPGLLFHGASKISRVEFLD